MGRYKLKDISRLRLEETEVVPRPALTTSIVSTWA